MYYFFLNPLGHFGENPVTFRVVFPLTQVIVICLTTGFGVATGVLAALGSSGLSTIFTGRISL
jgi:hypothetical protein